MGDCTHRVRGRAADVPGRDPPEGFVRVASGDGPSVVMRPTTEWTLFALLERLERVERRGRVPVASRIADFLYERARRRAEALGDQQDTPEAGEVSAGGSEAA